MLCSALPSSTNTTSCLGRPSTTKNPRPDAALAFFAFRAISGLRVQGENSGFYGCSATCFFKVLESKPIADLLLCVVEAQALAQR
jgi:hypothetical protein